MLVTTEFNQWQNRVFLMIQAIELADGMDDLIIPLLRDQLHKYVNNELGFKLNGIRVLADKSKE